MKPAVLKKDVQITGDASGLKDVAAEGILRALAYFDVFHYPLTREEITRFMGCTLHPEIVDNSLSQLMVQGVVFHYQDFYSIQNNPLLAHRRREGNKRAELLLVKAGRIGRFLYQFPFVRAIGISGSLSKNFADERSDIDFFIVTKANRLWIARTIMHLYKKFTFLTGRQHFYCMNYYVDEEALVLTERNIFTAIELKTLLPLGGNTTIKELIAANEWTTSWLPSCKQPHQSWEDKPKSAFKKIGEWLFDNRLGNRIDNYLLNITSNRWKHKEAKGKTNEKGLPMGLITGKHFARSNPGAFQEKVLAQYQARLTGLSIE